MRVMRMVRLTRLMRMIKMMRMMRNYEKRQNSIKQNINKYDNGWAQYMHVNYHNDVDNIADNDNNHYTN